MDSKDNGLTVGELTIALSTILIIGLVWTGVKNQIGSDKNSQLNSISRIEEAV